MQQKMHPNQSQDSCRHIVKHNSHSLRKLLQLPNRRRLNDIEGSEKYKTREKSFPCKRDRDQRDELSGDLINDNHLRIFAAQSSCDSRRSGNADQRQGDCQGDYYGHPGRVR